MIIELEGWLECTTCKFKVTTDDVENTNPKVTIQDVMMQHIKDEHASAYNRSLRKDKN